MVITTNPLVKCDMISVTLTANSTQTKIPFPDQPQLRDVFLQGIDFPYILNDYFGNGTVNQNLSYVTTSFLTLFFEGRENVQQIPLAELCSNTQSGIAYNINGSLGFFNQKIIWPKCFITMSGSNDPVTDVVFTFTINYTTDKI